MFPLLRGIPAANRFIVSIAGGFILIVAALALGGPNGIVAASTPTPTPYHEGVPRSVASPHAMAPPLYPLPGSEDRASADAMANGAAAMIGMAEAMDDAATVMLGSSDPQLVELGQHWALDAQALRQQASWMVLSATAADMIHDPATAHEINAWNLKGNGMAMSAEGQAMAEHGREMTVQIEELRRSEAIPEDVAADLVAAANDLIESAEGLQRDGERMQKTADQMLALIGR